MNSHVLAIVANDLFRGMYSYLYLDFVICLLSFARTYYLQSFLPTLPFLYLYKHISNVVDVPVKLWFLNP